MDPWISLMTLGVRDIERSRRFYRDGLGWPMSVASTEDVAFFRTGGMVLALYKWELLAADADLSPEGSGFAGISLAHNVATRELVDAALGAAVAAGGRCSNLEPKRSGAATPATSPTPTDSVGDRLEPGSSVARGWHYRPAVASLWQSTRERRDHALTDLPTS